MSINKNITKFRKYYKWSQQNLADKSGVSTGAISMIEAELRSPSTIIVSKICDAFCITIEELLEGKLIDDRMIYAKFKVLTELSDEDKNIILILLQRLRS